MRWYLRPDERLPQPPPPDHDDRKPVVTGTVVWGLLAVVGFLFLREDLAADGNEWWIWTAVSGFVLGLLGIAYMHRRRVRIATGQRPDSTEPG